MVQREMIAVCQMTATHDIDENYQTMKDMIKRAAERNCKMVFFPECCDFIGRAREESIDLAMREEARFVQQLRADAAEHRIWISVGTFHEKTSKTLIIDGNGALLTKYGTLQLFDLEVPGVVRPIESDFLSTGQSLLNLVETPVGRLGFDICYDVRYPELSLWHRSQGAQVLCYPAAFTANTGFAHWETLLRARAIETQCYVVAPAQMGKYNDNRSSYGHSMVVDPWGAVIAQCSDNIDMCFAEINLEFLEKIRVMQPVFEHRSKDIYSLQTNYVPPADESDRKFAEHGINKEVIFYRSEVSYGSVNQKPFMEGHVLVAPIREVKHLTDLTDQETSDLFNVAKRIQAMLQKTYNTELFTVALQDGSLAEQSVKRVRIHIVPRREGDFNGSDIYQELAKHDKTDRQPRDHDEMKKEAELYVKNM
ncbi:hypothetical protein QR680_002695 [Steinernema hermaphroditum]|uniref:bis(5'-adenosyl)-triphosphatase n=1 Tax=Steinernema hermaphroditum TaxID=289476 RepID=A0AA39LIL3_9BILA|nr:hypothetical protein QR680_002695 [Steinernema hermaphroditum]